MNAAQISQYGDPSVLEINTIETPKLTDGQILVEVYASSINPFDSKLRAGYMKDMIPLTFPATLGGDIAGVVTQVSDDVSSIAVGDKVYGQANVVAGNSGAFAEFAATAAGQVAVMPSNLDFKQAGSLPLVGVSALQALTEHLDIQPGQKLFIHGGAGGIGTVAIEIAKHLGADVTTTATGEAIELVTELGADTVIDYKAQDFSAVLSDFDAVFDLVGGDDFAKSLSVLKKGGVAVSMIAQPDETKASEFGVTAIMQSTGVTTERLNVLTELIESGVVTAQIDSVFPLVDISAAFEAKESGKTKGKIVIEINAS